MKPIFIAITISILFIWACSSTQPVVSEDTAKEDHSSQKKKEHIVAAHLKNYKINMDHYPAKGQNDRIRFLILHYTVSDDHRAIYLLTEKDVSSHYLVGDSINEIMLLVSEDKRAWHAGYSYWQGRNNLNDTSIGIEIVNKGFTGDFNFIPFKEDQIKKVGELSKNIVERYQLCATCVLGHSDIAPQRKYDPGPLFPWERMYYEYNVGAWYDKKDVRSFLYEYATVNATSKIFLKKVQEDLKKLGYEIDTDGVWGDKSKAVVRAFQFHFRPSLYDGLVDAETYAVLQALLKKYPNG